MKNIVFIVPSLSGGGAERVVSNLTKAIPDNYNKYIVIYHDTEKKYEHNGVVINLDTKGINNIFGKAIKSLRRIIQIRQIKKKNNIDVAISFLDNPNFVNVLSKSGEDVFVSIRNQQSKEYNGLHKILHRFIVKNVYSKANKVVAISEGVKLDLVENFYLNPESIEVIYNPIDVSRIDDLKLETIDEKYKDLFNGPTIVTVGRLEYQKGQWHLIRSFKKVVEIVPNAKLILLGTGSLEEKLKSIVSDLGLEKNVVFLGFQENPYKYIYKSDVFVLSSLFEGFGNVIIEAMACGTPVITTDCKSGPREIIAPSTNFKTSARTTSVEEYGIITPRLSGDNFNSKDSISEEEKELSEAIVLLLSDLNLRKKLINNSNERIKDFSFDNIVKQWLSL